MGKRFKAIDVFSMSIAELVDDMVTAGGKTVADKLDKDDFHIVLTVPAIWSDAAKQFMREAAIKKPVTKLFNLFLRLMGTLSGEATTIFILPPFLIGTNYMY